MIAALALRHACLQARRHVPALRIKRANVGDIEEGTVVDRKSILLANLFDQRKRIAQAAREDELGIFAPFDSSLEKVDKAENIMLDSVLLERAFNQAQLADRQREAGLIGMGLALGRPIEIQIGRFVIARRENIVGAGA